MVTDQEVFSGRQVTTERGLSGFGQAVYDTGLAPLPFQKPSLLPSVAMS